MVHLCEFFQSCVKHIDDVQYVEHRAKYPTATMILFSQKTRTPLAAVVLTTKNKQVQTLLTARPKLPESEELCFQAMLDQPDQVFYFNICNLYSSGTLNINIIQRQSAHQTTGSVNRINVLKALDCHTVLADQRTQREMILETLMEDGTQKPLSVQAAEISTSSGTRPRGLYFNLSVTPCESVPALVTLFQEGTMWIATDYYVDPLSIKSGCQSVVNEDDSDYWSEERPHDWRRPIVQSLEMTKGEAVFQSTARRIHRLKKSKPDWTKAQAAQLTYGGEVKQNPGVEVTETFAYEHGSVPCVLCMSIMPNFTLQLPTAQEHEEIVQETVREQIKTRGKDFITTLPQIYVSDKCCIDLESEADVVLCTCGHQCVNHVHAKNLRKCPLCRQVIVAKVHKSSLLCM